MYSTSAPAGVTSAVRISSTFVFPVIDTLFISIFIFSIFPTVSFTCAVEFTFNPIGVSDLFSILSTTAVPCTLIDTFLLVCEGTSMFSTFISFIFNADCVSIVFIVPCPDMVFDVEFISGVNSPIVVCESSIFILEVCLVVFTVLYSPFSFTSLSVAIVTVGNSFCEFVGTSIFALLCTFILPTKSNALNVLDATLSIFTFSA